jgi:hypothetical protein
MKKALLIVLAVLISVAFVTTVFAQEKKAEPKKDAPVAAPAKAAAPAPAKAEVKAEVKKEAKPKVHQFTGEVTAIDTAAKTLTAKKGKDEKAFDISNATVKAEPKTGDKVLVKYTEKDGKNIASSVTITKAAKKVEAKKDAPAAEKKAEPKKDVPAAAPAPAKK